MTVPELHSGALWVENLNANSPSLTGSSEVPTSGDFPFGLVR